MSWAHEELATVDLGDQRLNRRSQAVLERLGEKPNESIPGACRGWPETLAAYRLFANPKVSAEKVLKPHIQATIKRMAQEAVVLCVADTTELDYSAQKHTAGLGPLNYEKRRGILGHFLLAFTPERVPLGVLGADLWVRDSEHFGEGNQRARKPIEDKESGRWVAMAARCAKLREELPETTRLIYMGDRESDIQELLLELKQSLVDFVLRSQNDRSVDGEYQYLRRTVAASPVLGQLEFDVPAAPGRSARRVVQTVQACKVKLRGPRRVGKGVLDDVEVNVVYATEIQPPEGEDRIEWYLLSSLEAGDLGQAARVIEHYLGRWQIEVFFRILKSGCRVEQLQLEHINRLRPALAFYMIGAWRVQHLTMLGRACGELSCEAVLTPEEWRAVYVVVRRKPPPEQPPTLTELIPMLASLGGFLGRKHDGFPGPKSIWIGLQRTRDFVLALQAQRDADNCV